MSFVLIAATIITVKMNSSTFDFSYFSNSSRITKINTKVNNSKAENTTKLNRTQTNGTQYLKFNNCRAHYF
jgi:hypothetical protein